MSFIAVPEGEELVLEENEPSLPGTCPIQPVPISLLGEGMLYFSDPYNAAWTRLKAALELIGVHRKTTSYALFFGATLDTREDRYLHQIRIVTRSALRCTFKVTPERLHRRLHC